MAKILFFIEGVKASSGELASIAQITKAADIGDTIGIRSALQDTTYGTRIEACDYTAGTVPAAYSGVSVFSDTDTSPIVEADDAIDVVNSADDITVEGTVAVTDGTASVVLDATDTLVSSGDSFASVGSGSGTTATITVADGVITAVVLS